MTSPHTAGRAESLRVADMMRRYAEARARLYGPGPVRRRLVRHEPIVVVPTINEGRSLAVVPAEPVASTPCPLNMLACPSWRFLVAYAAAKHRVDRDDILSPFRGRQVTAARTEAIYLARTHVPGIGLTRLGLYFGRDHSTILTTLRRYELRKAQQQLSPLSTVFTGEGQLELTSAPVGRDGSY
jgi:hypothetical protein